LLSSLHDLPLLLDLTRTFDQLTTNRVAEGRILEAVAPAESSGSGDDERPRFGSTLVRKSFRMLARPLLDDSYPGPPLVYVSREGVRSGRFMTNERDLIRALEPLGFTSVIPEEMTLDHQMKTFSSARMIVGPSGAALTNMGFAPPGCMVVEIFPSVFRHGWNLNLAALMGHRYTYVVAAVTEDRITPVEVGGRIVENVKFEYEAPVARVVETVADILASAR
jgi:capsular polysaccharide biosynthesis protein